jgi:hypothetical protein
MGDFKFREPDFKNFTPDEMEVVVSLLEFLALHDDPNVFGCPPEELRLSAPDWPPERRRAACEALARRRVLVRQSGDELNHSTRVSPDDPNLWYCFEPSIFSQQNEHKAATRYRRNLIMAVEARLLEKHDLMIFLLSEGAQRLCYPVAD